MKIGANELKIGMLIKHKGKLWTVVKLQHVKPGKGGALLQAELCELLLGTKLNERFRTEEIFEKVRLDEAECQLLFDEDGVYTFMNVDTFDQMQVDRKIIGDTADFLQDNMTVRVCSYNGEIISVMLPDTVVMEVIEADAVVRAQTAASSYKPAMLENGVRIMVPAHIESGTMVIVNIADATYVERAK
jgi:elongation factor P